MVLYPLFNGTGLIDPLRLFKIYSRCSLSGEPSACVVTGFNDSESAALDSGTLVIRAHLNFGSVGLY